MINQCVHERSVNRLVSRNSQLSDSLKSHISECENCTKQYNILCHENSVLEESVSSFRATSEITESLDREVGLILSRYAKNEGLDRDTLRKKELGTLSENFIAFLNGLRQPVSIFLILSIVALYLIRL